MTLSDLGSEIDKSRNNGNLSSALRLYVLAYYQGRSRGHLLVESTKPTDL